MKQVTFSTTAYRYVHGHQPRGTGRWAFFFGDNTSYETAFWTEGTYTQAKAAAKKEAQRLGHTEVIVGC